MTANPLPNHVGPIVNAIVEDSSLRVKTKVDEVKASMEEIYEVLVKMRVIFKKRFLIRKESKTIFSNIIHHI